ncbi:MAG: NAD(P)-dependent alcohol dehydrogenase [Gammaproteobacteria bacterium]
MMHRSLLRIVPLMAVLAVGWGAGPAGAQTRQKQWQLVKSGAQGYSLKLGEAPVRRPAQNEVLVKMHAASLNRRDVFVQKGQYPMPPRDVVVPLSDGAGEVTAVGPGVKRFKVGDKVLPIFFPAWIEGRPTPSVTKESVGGAIDGVLTEYVTLNEQVLVALPAGLTYEEAATLPCAGVTAWNGLVTRGRMQAGDYVLLEGTGGVSVFGVQFAAAAGAKPIITSSSDEKLARAKLLGAIGGVNYRTTTDWEKPVRALAGGNGVQQLLEVGGKDSLPHALAALAPGGHIALIGGLGGFGGDIPAVSLISSNVSVSGIYVGSRENFEAMNAFITKHHIKPVVDKVFEFKDAQAAYELMESGNFFGKIVIRM